MLIDDSFIKFSYGKFEFYANSAMAEYLNKCIVETIRQSPSTIRSRYAKYLTLMEQIAGISIHTQKNTERTELEKSCFYMVIWQMRHEGFSLNDMSTVTGYSRVFITSACRHIYQIRHSKLNELNKIFDKFVELCQE